MHFNIAWQLIYNFFHIENIFLLTWKGIVDSMNKIMGIFAIQSAVNLLGPLLIIQASTVNYQLPPCFTLSYCPVAKDSLRYYWLNNILDWKVRQVVQTYENFMVRLRLHHQGSETTLE